MKKILWICICCFVSQWTTAQVTPKWVEKAKKAKTVTRTTVTISRRTLFSTFFTTGEYPLIITEDRWEKQKAMMQARLLAHLEVFDRIYARNCEVRKIDKRTAGDFLAANHSYGDASCRYRYGLFLKRYTGARKIQPEKGPQPIFCAKGPHFRQGAYKEQGCIIDIAPTLASVMGQQMPDAQGNVLADLLRKQ